MEDEGRRATLTQRRALWIRLTAEFLVIVASVYLAVFLEGASQERADHDRAREALTQLFGELREDRADFERVISLQDDINRDYVNLVRWLESPASMPSDSIGAALTEIFDNPTLFPRQASWRMMIASGQLSDLRASELILQLGHLYETAYSRLDYVSQFYDRILTDQLQKTVIANWDPDEATLLTSDPDEIRRFRSELVWIEKWNVSYRELLIGYLAELTEAIVSVEAFLND